MRNRTLIGLGLILFIEFIEAGCGSGSNPLTPSPVANGQACRTFATQWTETPTFRQPASATASFDAAAHVYSETAPGSSIVVQRTIYQSVGDFIDEPVVMGRILATRKESCASPTCAGGFGEAEVYSYDQQRRLTILDNVVAGFSMSRDVYSAWDNRGRPIAGTRNQPGLCTVPLTLTYDDAGRTVTTVPGQSSNILCLALTFSSSKSFDADGNLIVDTGSAGGTTTTTTRTITATDKICK